MNCGGGGGSNIYDKNNGTKKQNDTATLVRFQGVLADGYISGGNVKIRYSGLSVKTTSNTNGEYAVNIPSNAKNIKIFAKGGIDKDTDEVFEGLMVSSLSFDSKNTNSAKIWTTPITTILSSLIDNGKSESEARDIINTHLGLENGLDLLRVNPMSDNLSDTVKIKLFKATQQIQRVSELIKDVLGDDISYPEIAKAITRVITIDTGSDNIKYILKSNKISASIVALVSDAKKTKVLERLQSVAVSVKSIVDIIDIANIPISKIKLYSRSIELVSNSYETKASEIYKASSDVIARELKSDLNDISKTYTSLEEVNTLILKADAIAITNRKNVSLYMFSRSITKMISKEDTISKLDEIHTKVNIADSVITKNEKDILALKISNGIVIADTPANLEIPDKPEDKTAENTNGNAAIGAITQTPIDGNAKSINTQGKTPSIPSDNIGAISSSIGDKQPDYNSANPPKSTTNNPPDYNSNNGVPSL